MDFINKVNSFLEKDSWDLQKLIVIYWPTASGKTTLSIEMAKYLETEIISTDSRQIFIGLDIWTWKITSDEKNWIIHHMIDIIEPNQEYSVWQFKKVADIIINDIHTKWKIPILCWGTWLYIDSLVYDFNIPEIPAIDNLRNDLEKEALKYWNEYVYEKLQKIDPEYAKELHPNNIRYVIRALEVKMLTGKSKADFREEKVLKYDTLFLTPYDWNREELYKKIDARVSQMFDEWLVDEVNNLLNKYNSDVFWLQTIWYKEVSDLLLDLWIQYNWDKKFNLWEKVKYGIKLDIKETIELVQKNNRNYAKKQLTWFRKYEPEKNI